MLTIDNRAALLSKIHHIRRLPAASINCAAPLAWLRPELALSFAWPATGPGLAAAVGGHASNILSTRETTKSAKNLLNKLAATGRELKVKLRRATVQARANAHATIQAIIDTDAEDADFKLSDTDDQTSSDEWSSSTSGASGNSDGSDSNSDGDSDGDGNGVRSGGRAGAMSYFNTLVTGPSSAQHGTSAASGVGLVAAAATAAAAVPTGRPTGSSAANLRSSSGRSTRSTRGTKNVKRKKTSRGGNR